MRQIAWKLRYQMCIDISLEPEKMRPGNIPADSATPYTSDRQISRLAVRVAGNFDPFVIGDSHKPRINPVPHESV